MPRVAVSSVAVLKWVYGQPGLAEYEDFIPKVFAEAEDAPGFIVRARPVDDLDDDSNFQRDWGPWGEFCAPKFYPGGKTVDTDHRASIFALFTDLESLYTFTFNNLHRIVLKNRRKWVVDPTWRSYAIWWIDDDHQPTWREACDRIDYINEHGPTPHSFDLHHTFDHAGNPVKLRIPTTELEAHH